MRKITASAVCLALLLVFAVSCGGRGNASSVQATGPVDWSRHETFSVWMMADIYDEYSDYSENPIVWALNNKFNITLKYEQPVRGTENDAMALMFGTAEYTDMIDMGRYTGSIAQLYDEGVIVDIAQYLDYMPNFKRLMETDEGFRRISYNDDGKILTLRSYGGSLIWIWSGIVYRHDILESQTNGNVRFPSGNDYPKTIDDWEYMLPLFKSYFEGRGAADFAPLVIPYNGSFAYGDFANSFGAQSSYYTENDRVYYGPYEDAFYTYLLKMREWYANGWIYKDFASRVNDPFYLPNPALTYGGAAGAWFGLQGQVGDSMSMPDYGMFFDVRAAPSPLSVADGITEFPNFNRNPRFIDGSTGYAITTVCKNIPKLLSAIDYLYTEEGGLLKAGLTKETGSGENRIYERMGVPEGLYWYENGAPVLNPKIVGFSQNARNSLTGIRLPGMGFSPMDPPERMQWFRAIDAIWEPYPDAKRSFAITFVASRTLDEDMTFVSNAVSIDDYINSIVPRFIMGTATLNPQAWTDFKTQLRALGIEGNIRIQQAAYDRFLRR